MESDLEPELLPNAQWVHLCVDMQRIFSSEGIWPTPWMERVLPKVSKIAGKHPDRTIFTKFMSPASPTGARGGWRSLYEKWPQATRGSLPAEMFDLMPPLGDLCPPAKVFEKYVYSAFGAPNLRSALQGREAQGLIITGSETDVCVLSTVLSAVDFGYPVIIVDDAICSSSDTGHDSLMQFYHRRLSSQIVTIQTEQLLELW